MNILELLARDTVLGDGGYLLELERRGYVQAGPYTPEVVLEFPEAVRELHVEFLRAGAQVLQALTFYGSEDKLAAVGRKASAAELNAAAIRLARQAASGEALVAGCLTLSPGFVPGDARAAAQVRGQLERQVAWQLDAGADFLIAETFIYLEEALIATEVLRGSGVPVMVTMNIGPGGSRDGFAAGECARRLAAAGAHIVGANCSFEPELSLAAAREMRRAVGLPIACQPVGYRTPRGVPFTELEEFPLELDRIQVGRKAMHLFARKAVEAGIRYIGGCCGVAPYQVRAMAEALGRRPPASSKSPDLSRHVLPHVRERAALRTP